MGRDSPFWPSGGTLCSPPLMSTHCPSLLILGTRLGVAGEPRLLPSVLPWIKGSVICPKGLGQFEDASASVTPGAPPLHISTGGHLRPSTARVAGSGAGGRPREPTVTCCFARRCEPSEVGGDAGLGGRGLGRADGGCGPSPPFSSSPRFHRSPYNHRASPWRVAPSLATEH